jgi:GTPase
MLMVGGNAGLIGMSKEHLGVALALNVPIAVCVTKVSQLGAEREGAQGQEWEGRRADTRST